MDEKETSAWKGLTYLWTDSPSKNVLLSVSMLILKITQESSMDYENDWEICQHHCDVISFKYF